MKNRLLCRGKEPRRRHPVQGASRGSRGGEGGGGAALRHLRPAEADQVKM
jgi:hypothetical protein